MVVILLEVVATDSSLWLDLEGAEWTWTATGRIIDIAYNVHIVYEAKDCRIESDVDQLPWFGRFA